MRSYRRPRGRRGGGQLSGHRLPPYCAVHGFSLVIPIREASRAKDLALFVGLLLAQIADITTTNLGLHQGTGWEANPLMALAQAHLGTHWWVPKLVLVALAGIAVLSTRVRRSRVTLIVAASWVPPGLNLLEIL